MVRALPLLLAVVLVGACGGSREAPEPLLSNAPPAGEPGQTADLEPQTARPGSEFVGTGEAFDGPFTLGDAAIVMTVQGEFTRTRPSGSTDAGSYLVTEDGRLVLFLERIGESRLTTARPEVHLRSELVPAP